MDDVCGRLADWVLNRRWNHISSPAQDKARHLLIDTLACALGGRRHPAVFQAASVAAHLSGNPMGGAVATGLGSGARLSTFGAILDSGAAIRALDLNDFYWGPGLGGHPSDIFAVGLAVAEEVDCRLSEMLCAVSAGYELYTRLMDLMRPGDPPWPWDHTSACGPAAALISGRLLGLDRTQLAEAFAIAAARAPVLSALRAGKISSSKAVAPALGEIDGLLATRLAQVGVTGPREVIAGPRGLEAIIVPGADLDHLIPLDSEHERVLDITIKRFPCMGTGQAATATAVELQRQLRGRTAEISAVELELSDSAIVRRQTADVYRRPDRRETADHSFYAIFGMALADGRLEPAQFAARRWADPDVVAIIDKLELIPDLPGADEGIFSAKASLALKDGTTLNVDTPYAPGHRLNPVSEHQLVEKFRVFAEPVIGDEQTTRILQSCLARSEDPPVRQIIAHCAKA
jgi:2-methylcitrate dehydratase